MNMDPSFCIDDLLKEVETEHNAEVTAAAAAVAAQRALLDTPTSTTSTDNRKRSLEGKLNSEGKSGSHHPKSSKSSKVVSSSADGTTPAAGTGGTTAPKPPRVRGPARDRKKPKLGTGPIVPSGVVPTPYALLPVQMMGGALNNPNNALALSAAITANASSSIHLHLHGNNNTVPQYSPISAAMPPTYAVPLPSATGVTVPIPAAHAASLTNYASSIHNSNNAAGLAMSSGYNTNLMWRAPDSSFIGGNNNSNNTNNSTTVVSGVMARSSITPTFSTSNAYPVNKQP